MTFTALPNRSLRRITIDKGLFHLLAALCLLPGYFNLGQEFKIVMIPYVSYLILDKRASYLPALLVHFLPGTLVSQAILAACAVLSLINLKLLLKLRLGTALVVTILPFPLVVFAAIRSGEPIIEVGQYLSLYLGLFAFFYGSLIADQVDEKIVKRVLWVLFGCALLQTTGFTGGTVRYYFLAVPALIIVGASRLIPGARWHFSVWLSLAAVIIVTLILSGVLKVTFIILFSTIVAILLLLARIHWTRVVKGLPVGKVLVIFALVITGYMAAPVSSEYAAYDQSKGIQDIEEIDDVLPALKFKLFGDRGLLWKGAWKTVQKHNGLLPPEMPSPIVYVTNEGLRLQVGFGAHNIGLELLRSYGWLAGAAAAGMYLLFLSYSGVALVRSDQRNILLPVLAAVTAVAFVGGVFGHFVLNNNFSFLLLALGGVGYGSYRVGLRKYSGATP